MPVIEIVDVEETADFDARLKEMLANAGSDDKLLVLSALLPCSSVTVTA